MDEHKGLSSSPDRVGDLSESPFIGFYRLDERMSFSCRKKYELVYNHRHKKRRRR